MRQALLNKKLEGVHIPSERTVYRVMEKLGISHMPKRKPHGITKADKESQKSDDLIKRDFTAEAPLKKCITDITEITAADGKLYVSAIFDCFDVAVVGLAMADNMRAELCISRSCNKNFKSKRLHCAQGLYTRKMDYIEIEVCTNDICV